MAVLRLTGAATDAELARWAAVKNAVTPTDPVAIEQLRRDLAGGRRTLLLLAELDGVDAGCGIAAASSVEGAAFALARVLPAFRGRGVGSALYGALRDHAARALGAERVWTRVTEDDAAGLEFVTRRGFVQVGRECQSRLALSAAAAVAPPPEGVEIVSLAERLDLVPDVHALAVAASRDIPTAETFTVPALDDWRRENVDAALVEGSFLALAGGRLAGYAGLAAVPAATGVAENLLTAVAAAWRRRGVARALKSAQIAWARAGGFRELVTYSEEANEPMRRLNAALGYRRLPDDLRFQSPPLPLRDGHPTAPVEID